MYQCLLKIVPKNLRGCFKDGVLWACDELFGMKSCDVAKLTLIRVPSVV